MTVKVTDLSPQFLKQYRDASRMALDAAAALYEGNVKKRFMQGYYTSQAFRSTAQIVQHIQRDEPTFGGNGWYTKVGIPDGIMAIAKPKNGRRSMAKASRFSIGKIALAWELGHQNLFTRRWERVSIFKPVAAESMRAMVDTYNRVLNRMLERGRAVR